LAQEPLQKLQLAEQSEQLILIVYQVILATAIQRRLLALTAATYTVYDANNCTDPTPVQVTTQREQSSGKCKQ
jgi:hypothetical protein